RAGSGPLAAGVDARSLGLDTVLGPFYTFCIQNACPWDGPCSAAERRQPPRRRGGGARAEPFPPHAPRTKGRGAAWPASPPPSGQSRARQAGSAATTPPP